VSSSASPCASRHWRAGNAPSKTSIVSQFNGRPSSRSATQTSPPALGYAATVRSRGILDQVPAARAGSRDD
jgi:hypothetical protein